MKMLVIGASGLSHRFDPARYRFDTNPEIILVDKDRPTLDQLSETIDCGMVVGDGTAPAILKEACGDTKPDVLVSLTGSDQANLIAALVGRQIGIERVLPQVRAPELSETCRELEIDHWIAPDELIAREIERIIGISLESEADQDEDRS